MGVTKNLTKTILKQTPAGAALGVLKGIGSALGIGGKTAADYRKERYRKAYASLYAGDWGQVQNLANNSQYPGLRVGMAWALRQYQRGVILDTISAYLQASGGEQTRLGNGPDLPVGGVPSSPGSVPISAGGNSTPGTTSTSGGSVPTVPRPKPPCKYGPRDPVTGYCPKKPPATATTPSYITPQAPGGRPKPPCKYGPRDADGFCPKRPSVYSTRTTKADQAALRKAQSAASSIVTAGLKGAGSAIKAGLAAAGVGVGTAVGVTAAVGVAAISGWMIGKAISGFLESHNPEQLRANAAVDANHARRALAEQLGVYDPNAPGVGLTMDQQQGIKDAYAKAIAEINGFTSDSEAQKRLEQYQGG